MSSKFRGLGSLWLFFLIAVLTGSGAIAAGLPSSTITAPANNSAISASLGSYTIRGTAVDNSGTGLKKVEVSFNGGSTWSQATGTTSWSLNWSPLPLGSYSITSRATDNANGIGSPAPGTHVVVDGSAPSSTITAPSAGSSLNGASVTVKGVATDTGGAGVQKVEVSTNGGTTWSIATGTTSWSFSWTLPVNGSYTIKSRATDKAGNAETPGGGVTVSVANVVGTVSLDKASYYGPTDRATVTVDDKGAGATPGPGNDSITARVTSASDGTGETVTLYEDASVADRFRGSFGFEPLKAFAAGGKVYVSKGDTVSVTYTDGTTPSGVPQAVTASCAWDGGRAMWLRNAADIINNTGTARAGLYAFCLSPHGNASARVDTVYLDPADAVYSNPTFLRGFISDAHAHGLRVECLMGSPGWATSSGLATAGAAIDAATSFNDAGSSGERFDGIHLDVDPSLLPNWATQTASVWSDYMALLNYCESKVAAYDSVGHDLTLALDIPSWFDTAYPGITSSDAVQGAVDYVVVKSGSDTAQGISSSVQHETDYARSVGKKALAGVETACGVNPESATFCEEGCTVMDSRLGSAASNFQANKAFMGFAVNDYQAYQSLSQLPDSPVTAITAPVDGSAISGTGYTVKGTASSVVGVQKVEVSTDGGASWHAATDTSGNGSWSGWSYAWSPLPAGSAVIKARATDTMGDVENPGASVGVQVLAMKHLGITVSPAGGGSVSANPASPDGYYTSGTQVTLTAAPANGYSFTGWSGDASGTTNPLTLAMDADKGVTANFTLIRYRLTTAVNDASGGSVTPGGDYDSGSVVQVNATANPGYVFTGWSGDAAGSANPAGVTMTGNKSVTANFVRQGISLAWSQGATTVTLTATMYFNGSPASGRNIAFYEQTGTGGFVLKGTVTTNTSGVAVRKFTSTAGDHHAYAAFTASGGIPSMQSNTVAYTIGKVVLVSPASGSVAASANPTLSWQAYPGASLYHVQVAPTSKFGTGTVSATTTGTSATSAMTLVHGKTYYWRVYADIPAGTTMNSDTWKMSY